MGQEASPESWAEISFPQDSLVLKLPMASCVLAMAATMKSLNWPCYTIATLPAKPDQGIKTLVIFL